MQKSAKLVRASTAIRFQRVQKSARHGSCPASANEFGLVCVDQGAHTRLWPQAPPSRRGDEIISGALAAARFTD